MTNREDYHPQGEDRRLVTDVSNSSPWGIPVLVGAAEKMPWDPTLDPNRIIDLYGCVELEVIVTQNSADLDGTTGELDIVTDWSGKLWLGGGRPQDRDPHQKDYVNAFWSEAQGCDFVGVGPHSFNKRFPIGGFRWAMFNIYDTDGDIYVIQRKT